MAHKTTVMNVEVDTDDEVNLIKDIRAEIECMLQMQGSRSFPERL